MSPGLCVVPSDPSRVCVLAIRSRPFSFWWLLLDSIQRPDPVVLLCGFGSSCGGGGGSGARSATAIAPAVAAGTRVEGLLAPLRGRRRRRRRRRGSGGGRGDGYRVGVRATVVGHAVAAGTRVEVDGGACFFCPGPISLLLPLRAIFAYMRVLPCGGGPSWTRLGRFRGGSGRLLSSYDGFGGGSGRVFSDRSGSGGCFVCFSLCCSQILIFVVVVAKVRQLVPSFLRHVTDVFWGFPVAHMLCLS